MTRNPYDAHLCAQDPEAFQAGFDFVEKVYQAVKDSDGGLDWDGLGIPHLAWWEGFVLAVYGVKALERLA